MVKRHPERGRTADVALRADGASLVLLRELSNAANLLDAETPVSGRVESPRIDRSGVN